MFYSYWHGGTEHNSRKEAEFNSRRLKAQLLCYENSQMFSWTNTNPIIKQSIVISSANNDSEIQMLLVFIQIQTENQLLCDNFKQKKSLIKKKTVYYLEQFTSWFPVESQLLLSDGCNY